MTYIYDILVNFSECYFDFYDWNENDNILHVKKMPIIKVNSDFLYNVKFNDVIVSKDLIDRIFNRAEFFKKRNNRCKYVCCLCDGNSAIGVSFDISGNVLYRSSLLLDEENEIINITDDVSVDDYSFIVNNVNDCDFFKTRYEIYIQKYIVGELNLINDDKLQYLYYDCFDRLENNKNVILKDIYYELENNFSAIYLKIYDFLKLASINNR